MNKAYGIIFLVMLFGCAANKYVFVGNEYQSPIDLTAKYIDSEVKGFKNENVARIVVGKEGRELKNSYCIDDNFSKESFVSLIGKHCEYQNGVWVNNKWCLSENNKKLKYAVEIDNANMSEMLRESRGMALACKSKKNVDVYIKEYTTPGLTDNIQIVTCPQFYYPAAAVRLGLEGKVAVKLKISPNGRVSEKILQSSSGHDRLDEAGMRFFSRCVFIPKFTNGVAVEDWRELKINYKIKNSSVE